MRLIQPAGDPLGPYGSRHQSDGIRGDLYLQIFSKIQSTQLPGEDALLADEVRAVGNEH